MTDTNEKKFSSWRILSDAKFAETYSEGCRNGERFCFILGSGASVESGIPMGGSLEYDWMRCLMGEAADRGTAPMDIKETRNIAKILREEEKLQCEFADIEQEWERARSQGRQTLSSEYYFDIYKLRFYPNSRNGYRYLERLMEHAEPSFGYHPLARLLTDEYNNNLVITTNFDSLVEDALFLYTDQKPLTINHELVADFIGDHSIRRPIVAKLHRGLFFDPLNDPETTTGLKGNWKKVLREIFHIYTPVVIGYGGGDQSLMKLLEEEDLDLPRGIYWCYVDKYGLPGENIQELLKSKNGFFVQTEGFDQIMLALGNKMCHDEITPGRTLEYLKRQMDRRMSRYSEQIQELEKKGKEKGSEKLNEGITTFNENEAAERKERKEKGEMTAWDYYEEGRAFARANEYEKAVESYSRAIELNLHNPEVFRHRGEAYIELDQYDKALADYDETCRSNPKDQWSFFYRGSLYITLHKHEEALQDFHKVIQIDPGNGLAYKRIGDIYSETKDYDKALNNYNKSIEFDSGYHLLYKCIGDVYTKLQDYNKALENYNKAIELDPNFWPTYKRRSEVYLKLGMMKEAEADEKMAGSLWKDE